MRVYKFNNAGKKYYGQGVAEEEVRICMESRLNLAPGTLAPGTSKLSISEIRKVSTGRPNVNELRSRLNLRGNIQSMSPNRMSSLTKKDIQQICSVISKTLNVPREYVDSNVDSPLSLLLKASLDKILVDTHKFIKVSRTNKVVEEDGVRLVHKMVVTGLESRVDAFRETIRRLLSQDFSLLVEAKNTDHKIRQAEIAIGRDSKIAKLLDRRIKEDDTDDIESEIQRLKEKKNNDSIDDPRTELEKLLQEKALEESVILNTGFYVNAAGYDNGIKDYPQLVQEFDNLYGKIRRKLVGICFDRLPYDPKNPEITMLDALDSYLVIEHNRYVRVSKNEKDVEETN